MSYQHLTQDQRYQIDRLPFDTGLQPDPRRKRAAALAFNLLTAGLMRGGKAQ